MIGWLIHPKAPFFLISVRKNQDSSRCSIMNEHEHVNSFFHRADHQFFAKKESRRGARPAALFLSVQEKRLISLSMFEGLEELRYDGRTPAGCRVPARCGVIARN